MQHGHRSGFQIYVLDMQGQCLAAPHAGSVEHCDERSMSHSKGRRRGALGQKSSDFIGCEHFSGVATSLVRWHATAVVAGFCD